MKIGEKIKNRLRMIGMTQKELAQRSGYSESTITKICNGYWENIGITMLLNISTVLKLKITDLLEEQASLK